MSASIVSLIERGHLRSVSVPTFRRVATVLEIRAEIHLTLPHGDLDRLLTAGHAALHEALARYLASLPGWIQAPEVSFAVYGERGVIDILAFHEPTSSLLVIELKTELVSVEDLLTTMDVRMRHAMAIARSRGWHARTVSAWVVFAESRTTRRRVHSHQTTLRNAFPADGRAMRSWLVHPTEAVRAMSFWTDSSVATVRRSAGSVRRVRLQASVVRTGQAAG